MKTHIIYVPGLGDGYDGIREFALKRWRSGEVRVTFAPMKWNNIVETYEDKLGRIKQAIDAVASDTRVVLVGESAGGSMVVNATHGFDSLIAKTITICGKNVREDRVSGMTYARHPAFRSAMRRADEAAHDMTKQQRSKFTIFYSPFDQVIHPVDTFIHGAKVLRLHTPGHLLSILMVLFFLKHRIIAEAVGQ